MTDRIVPLTALRAAPAGEILADTGKASVAPLWTDEVVEAGGQRWRKAEIWVRTDRITTSNFVYMKQLADRADVGAPEHRNSAECGLCSISMALSTLGIKTARVDELSDKYDPTDDGTNANDLIRMAADYGQTFVAKSYNSLIPEPYTACLGMYGGFRERSKLDLPGFLGAHWVEFIEQLPNSDVVIADSLYRTDRGARVVWSLDEWSRYWIKWGAGAGRVGVTPDRRGRIQRMLGGGGTPLPDWIMNKRNDVAEYLA